MDRDKGITFQTSLEGAFQKIYHELDEIKRCLFGNTNEGLKTQVAKNTEFRLRVEKVVTGIMARLITLFIIQTVIIITAVYLILAY